MKIKKHQEGGQVAAPAPGAEQGGDPIQMLAEMAVQGLETQDCAIMAQVCEGFIMMLQQSQGQAQPISNEPQGEPVFRKGGKLVKRI